MAHHVRLSTTIANLAVLMPLHCDVQRALDSERVGSIRDYQCGCFSASRTFMFLGDLIFGTDQPVSPDMDVCAAQVIVLDGQHRLAAMRDIYHLQPEYRVSCTVVQLTSTFTAAEAFRLINLSEPVPSYVIQTIFDATRRKMLDDLRDLFVRAFRAFLSKSRHPRRPNVNVDTIMHHVSLSQLLMTRFTSADQLMRYVSWVNQRIPSRDEKTRALAIKKAQNKTVTPLFLGVDASFEWTTDQRLLSDFFRVHQPPEDAPVRPACKKRPRVPSAVRNACWVARFGTAIQGTCTVCGTVPITRLDFHAAHIIPHSKGGPDTAQNMQPVCATCNTSMGANFLHTYQHVHFSSNI
jgi:5-methylcytosine-specific restriction endonuclease McrA